MTKDEKLAERIAAMFLKAVSALESFQADPQMVYDDLRVVSHGAPAKVRTTMGGLADWMPAENEPHDGERFGVDERPR